MLASNPCSSHCETDSECTDSAGLHEPVLQQQPGALVGVGFVVRRVAPLERIVPGILEVAACGAHRGVIGRRLHQHIGLEIEVGEIATHEIAGAEQQVVLPAVA